MPGESAFNIRLMRPYDLNQVFCLSMNESWNQTLKDWSIFLNNPDSVCIVDERDKEENFSEVLKFDRPYL
jgi:hypothetical protein